MRFQNLNTRMILITAVMFGVGFICIARASVLDHRKLTHSHSSTKHASAVKPKHMQKSPKPAAKSVPIPPKRQLSAKPETAIRTAGGKKCVELAGDAATYMTPLQQLLKEKGISHPHNIQLQVIKSERLAKLLVDGQLIKSYVVSLGREPDVPKTSRGDRATPDGDYYVCEKLPQSRFYLSLKLSYPNAADAERGLQDGLIDQTTYRRIRNAVASRGVPPMNTNLGGDICIHGGGAGPLEQSGRITRVRVRDWTAGCIALENTEMKELFDFIPVGTKVKIAP